MISVNIDYFPCLLIVININLWLHLQVVVNYNEESQKIINASQYWPAPNDQVLDAVEIISEVWPGPPPHRHLHVFVGLPRGECCVRLFALAQGI
jgi:hypothetical protein